MHAGHVLICEFLILTGRTETTIVATWAECSPGKTITIGRPIPNCEVILLNEELQPVPQGEFGELCISGIGLSKGYINNDDLNRAKFISHPTKQGELLYRTGDRAFYTEEGELQFAGRLDYQIKLRGFRIELGGLEQTLKEFPGYVTLSSLFVNYYLGSNL